MFLSNQETNRYKSNYIDDFRTNNKFNLSKNFIYKRKSLKKKKKKIEA